MAEARNEARNEARKEYIEREALMEQVKAIHKAVNTADRNLSYDTGFHCATSQIQGLIAWMPAADVVEVKRGEWYERDGKMWCSLCDKSNKQYKPPFCPNCGADMRGENN